MDAKSTYNLQEVLWVDSAQRIGNNRSFLRVLWLGAVTAVIILSLLPGSSPALHVFDITYVSDKIQHMAAYAVLAFIPMLHERTRVLFGTTLFLLITGVGLEFGQLASDGRSFELGDILADCLGLFTGLVVGMIPRSRMKRVLCNARWMPLKGESVGPRGKRALPFGGS